MAQAKFEKISDSDAPLFSRRPVKVQDGVRHGGPGIHRQSMGRPGRAGAPGGSTVRAARRQRDRTAVRSSPRRHCGRHPAERAARAHERLQKTRRAAGLLGDADADIAALDA